MLLLRLKIYLLIQGLAVHFNLLRILTYSGDEHESGEVLGEKCGDQETDAGR